MQQIAYRRLQKKPTEELWDYRFSPLQENHILLKQLQRLRISYICHTRV